MQDYANSNTSLPAHALQTNLVPQTRNTIRRSFVSDKGATRKRGLANGRAVPFAEMANDPLYRRIANAVCPEALKKKLKDFGLDTAARAASFDTPVALNADIARRTSPDQQPVVASHEFMAEAQREALRSYRIMRHAITARDPMSQGFRHNQTALSSEVARAIAEVDEQGYANPTALNSNQSPAAYLRHLYRIATGLDTAIGLVPPKSTPFRLEDRRPDLAMLVLSEENLKQEIPTIVLVNEVLESGLGDIDLQKAFHPIALPFNAPAHRTRIALERMNGTSLSTLRARTAPTTFPMEAGFRLAWDEAGILGLEGTLDTSSIEGSEISLLSENGADDASNCVPTLGGLYDAEHAESLSNLSSLLSHLDIGFEELAQILGLYTVRQENGATVEQWDFATSFIDNMHAFKILENETDKVIRKGDMALELPDLRSLNYLVRLHKSTGLSFHHLNWLLALPGATKAAPDNAEANTSARRYITKAGLRVLAGYLLYRERFDLSVEAYAALFGQICPFWRADVVVDQKEPTTVGLEQTETSFMRQVFGADAPVVHESICKGTTTIKDQGLAAIVRRSLRLTEAELETLVAALAPGFDLASGVDPQGLGALFRLRKVFEMLGWPIAAGLRLVALFSEQSHTDKDLLQHLTARIETAEDLQALCGTIDQLVAMSEWMQDMEIAPDLLLAMLTTSSKNGIRPTDADGAWLGTLAEASLPHRVCRETFGDFQAWVAKDGSKTEISNDVWFTHVAGEDGLIWTSGIFRPSVVNGTVRTVITHVLEDQAGVDPFSTENAPNLDRLVLRLERLHDAQAQELFRRVAALNGSVSIAGAEPIILWAQTDPFTLLNTLLLGEQDANALFWLHEMRRYCAVAETFELGDIELWIMGHKPNWLIQVSADLKGDLNKPLPVSLEQLFYLRTFATLQVDAATDAAWRGYLAFANEGEPAPDAMQDEATNWQRACSEALAILLGAEQEDVALYIDTIPGIGTVVRDIRELDTIARHVRLANELNMGAAELLALCAIADTHHAGDWVKAATAAEAALSRFGDVSQLTAVEHAFSEVRRDALVAAYMKTKVANDPELKNAIKDKETLYRHLLLDVQVTSAVPTSRIVEATSSLQLYINRALGWLEAGVGFRNRQALLDQWQIDKEYRLWEANQKLLLYPQNYIEPDLRYITSPEFDDLLQAVSGKNIDADSVEASVNAYMAGLARCCDLKLCSIFVDQQDAGSAPDQTTYHFLARAQWEPGRFFYRKLDADYALIAELADPSQYLKALDWTYWQEVIIPSTYEVFSDVSVCYFRNRYFFFWLEIEKLYDQGTNTDEISWRIHPRYMRCDNNALTGPMHTPGVFVTGALPGSDKTPKADGAIVWKGHRPKLNGTYHPARITDVFTYGKVASDTAAPEDASTAIFVTFGIDLDDGQTNSKTHRTSLQLRLTEEWADAIHILDEQVNTQFDDAAPAGYNSVYPRPKSLIGATADVDLVQKSHDVSGQLDIKYYEVADHNADWFFLVLNQYQRGHCTSNVRFQTAEAGAAHIGSLDVDIDLGARTYFQDRHGYVAPGDIYAVEEMGATRILTRYTLTFQTPGEQPRPYTTDWMGGGTLQYKNEFGIPPRMPNETIHVAGEHVKSIVPLPAAWALNGATQTKLTVQAEVKREAPSLKARWYGYIGLDDMDFGDVTLLPEAKTKTIKLDLGTFNLGITDVKSESAWTLGSEHGNQTFVHVMPGQNRSINDTILLLNSSSALTQLARSMPKPGGCEQLFVRENQMLPEAPDGFINDFASTLQRIYPGDPTTLDPTRTPDELFDFDGSYGGYGWEVFYHIPTAIAAGYASAEQFDDALAWLGKIFDPNQDMAWRLHPLSGASAPENGLVFDTGDVIVDPDRLAQDYPFYYKQATLRQYLETLVEAGDTAYREPSQKSLQRAKSIYVSAKQLFRDELSELLEVATPGKWEDPTLTDVSSDGCTDFLPPYNQEIRGLYDTIEGRLSNLRDWRDIDGEPLNLPLLNAPIDPQVLQKAAKTKLSLRSGDFAAEPEAAPKLEFLSVARSARAYIANLKMTSSRLQAAIEKGDGKKMSKKMLTVSRNKACRAAALQDLEITAMKKEIDVKEANVASAQAILADHVGNVFVEYGIAMALNVAARSYLLLDTSVGTLTRSVYRLGGSIKSKILTIAGTSSGGQDLSAADTLGMMDRLGASMDKLRIELGAQQETEAGMRLTELTSTTVELSTKLRIASLERNKAQADLTARIAAQANLVADTEDAEALEELFDSAFSGIEFYDWMVSDLEKLFGEEWAATQDFCRILIQLYEAETGVFDGATYLRTTSLGGQYERFNAPHRLALDMQRLEAAYLREMTDLENQSTRVSFRLSDIPALGSEISAADALIRKGEVYFELTDEMFDTFYPGQFDRRVQGVCVRFPGLAAAGLTPHARLKQVTNTRYLTPERDRSRPAMQRRDLYGLQSILIGAPEVDTTLFDRPDGVLKPFQNTGVHSTWCLSIPSLQERGRKHLQGKGKRAWQQSAGRHVESVRSHLDDVAFEVAFSGRW